MNRYEFFEGQALSEIWWADENSVRVGKNDVVSIKVSMEAGQMAAVPWAIAFYKNGRCVKYNLAAASEVELSLKG